MKTPTTSHVARGVLAGFFAGLFWGSAEQMILLQGNRLQGFSHIRIPFWLVHVPTLFYIVLLSLAGVIIGFFFDLLSKHARDGRGGRWGDLILTILLFVPPFFFLQSSLRFLALDSRMRALLVIAVPLCGLALIALCLALLFFCGKLKNRKNVLHVLPSTLSAILFLFCLVHFLTCDVGPIAVGDIGDRGIPKEGKYNVILVTIDTLRSDGLGCYGNGVVETDFIDSLARDGVRFSDVYSCVPLTLPSHSTIMTSLYPFSHGVRDNGRYVLSGEMLTLAEILSDRGYFTGAITSAYVVNSKFGINQGFDIYDDQFMNIHLQFFLLFRQSFALMRFLERHGLEVGVRAERGAGETTQRALSLLDECRDRQFFLWLHYFDPHSPYTPPSSYAEKYFSLMKVGEEMGKSDPGYLKALYFAEIDYTDDQLERVVRRLEELRLLDSTIIVVTSDHGQAIHDHNYTGHTDYLYEQIMRIPLIVVHPDWQSSRGKVINNIVQSVDIMPTILDALGIEDIPSNLQGRSLVDLVEENNSVDYRGEDVYLETLHPRNGTKDLYGMRREDWKYVYAPGGTMEELYDLGNDPDENVNLIGTGRDIADRLKEDLTRIVALGTAEEEEMDFETKQSLRALGYIE